MYFSDYHDEASEASSSPLPSFGAMPAGDAWGLAAQAHMIPSGFGQAASPEPAYSPSLDAQSWLENYCDESGLALPEACSPEQYACLRSSFLQSLIESERFPLHVWFTKTHSDPHLCFALAHPAFEKMMHDGMPLEDFLAMDSAARAMHLDAYDLVHAGYLKESELKDWTFNPLRRYAQGPAWHLLRTKAISFTTFMQLNPHDEMMLEKAWVRQLLDRGQMHLDDFLEHRHSDILGLLDGGSLHDDLQALLNEETTLAELEDKHCPPCSQAPESGASRALKRGRDLDDTFSAKRPAP